VTSPDFDAAIISYECRLRSDSDLACQLKCGVAHSSHGDLSESRRWQVEDRRRLIPGSVGR